MKIACIIAYDISFVGQTIDILRDVESSIQEYSLLMTRCVVKKRRGGGGKKEEGIFSLCISTILFSLYVYIYMLCTRNVGFFLM